MENRCLAASQGEGKRQDAKDWGSAGNGEGIIVVKTREASLLIAAGAIGTRRGFKQPRDGVAPREVQGGMVVFRDEGNDAAGNDGVGNGNRHSLGQTVTEAGEDDTIASGVRGDHGTREDHHLGSIDNQPLESGRSVHETGESHRQRGGRGQDGAGLGDTLGSERVGPRESGKIASGLEGHIMDSEGSRSGHGEQEMKTWERWGSA